MIIDKVTLIDPFNSIVGDELLKDFTHNLGDLFLLNFNYILKVGVKEIK